MSTPHKPRVDSWDYRSFRLANRIDVLLVSDPDADKAAAAVDINVGSMSDDDLPGLAHFCEHMLFYASAKYPNEDEFSKWVNDHGGRSNAYTAAEHTNYHFSVNWDALESTLDRFAQFFTSPLISAEGIERERNAVSSEHDGNINNDAWRQSQLWKKAGNQAHPYTRFFTGNMTTLGTRPAAAGIDVHKAVVDFHSEYYSANRMKLVVMGRDTLDQLQGMVQRTFSDVPNKDLERLTEDGSHGEIYGPEQMGKLVSVVPMNEGHTAILKWVIPSQHGLWREQPASFLGHLIGHEGRGSLFSLLKEKGWAKSLSAGSYEPISSTSLFTVSIGLTDAGHTNIKDVVNHTFQYIDLLKRELQGDSSRRLFEDNCALKRLAFDFRENPSASSYTTLLANMMHDYPLEHLLESMYHVPLMYDEDAVRAALECLSPERTIMMWASKTLEGQASETEEWYGQKYSIVDIPRDWMDSWKNPGSHVDLHLPEINPFTPTDLSLKAPPPLEADALAPTNLVNDATVSMWYKTYLEFKAPKATLRLRFILPNAFSTPEAYMTTVLYKSLLVSELNELSYPAELAGLHYAVETHTGQASGLQINMSGYSDKMLELLGRVAALLQAFEVLPDRLAIEKERYRDSMQNRDRQPPYHWCIDFSDLLLHSNEFHIDDVLAALPDIEAADVQRHIDHVLFSRARVEGLIIGNVDDKLAGDVVQVARGVLSKRNSRPILPSLMGAARLIQLPPASHTKWRLLGRNKKDINSAHLSLYQVGKQHDIRASVMMALVEQIGSRDAFHELRTVQQIGYVVHMFTHPSHGVPHIGVLLQSSSLSAAAMDAAVTKFLLTWRTQLKDELTEEIFQEHVAELVKSFLEKAQNLRTYATRWFREITIARFKWDIAEQSAAELKTVTREELLEFVDAMFAGAQRRLTIDIQGTHELGEAATNGNASNAANNGVTSSSEQRCEDVGSAGVASSAQEELVLGERAEGDGLSAANGNAACNVMDKSATDARQNGSQTAGDCDVPTTIVEDWAKFRHSQQLWPAHRQVW